VTVLNYIAIVAIFSPKKKNGEGDCSASFKKAGNCGGGSFEQVNKLVQDSSTPSAKKEPLSRQEKQMAVIICACILLWIFEPLTGIESHVVAVCAFGATLICGIVDKAEMRAKIAWDSLIFIGIVLGLANVFAYLGIDTWIVESCAPLFSALASNPYLFILGIGVTTVILRFVIVSEMAYINLFMAFMVPLAVNFGISPWVVGVCVYAMVNPWFVLYQNPIYLSAYYATDAKMVNHSTMAKYCLLYLTICQCALLASVPYWQFLGIL
jgi:di/tricarboxylate transporter